MNVFAIAVALCCVATSTAQQPEVWDATVICTASNETYLSAKEKEMIAEINRVRTNPKAYKAIVQPYLDEAEALLKQDGKGTKSYSIETTYRNGKPTGKRKIYHYANEEEVKALQSLMEDLETMQPLNALLPSANIHKACKKHARDQTPTGDLNHLGTDGSWPSDRITKYAPEMRSGNENLVGGKGSARYLVLLLLIDSGIEGYGHRYNMLDPDWTHVSCLEVGDIATDDYNMDWWIQNFGQIRE